MGASNRRQAEMSDAVRTAQIRIEGRVQGVGYRMWTQHAALALGLAGWVRNRRDGSVEAVFQGSAADVAAMIAACEQGPRAASVSSVKLLAEVHGVFTDFDVRGTA